MRDRLNFACGNRLGVFSVKLIRIGVKGDDKFVVRYDLTGRENAASGNGWLMHEASSQSENFTARLTKGQG
jgi:hypothetical protein